VLAAAVLTVKSVSCLLVGSAALRLQGAVIPVGDADVVIEPSEQNIRRLHAALMDMAVRPGTVPALPNMSRLQMITARTSYGKIDCLLKRGRLDWERLHRSAVAIQVADARILVAAHVDAWVLRRQFKE
jgi:hypothetical protein